MYKNITNNLWLMALIMVVSMIGCGSVNSDPFEDTGAVCVGGDCVPLGLSGDPQAAAGYVIMAKTAISTVPTSIVTGNIGLSPAARDDLTGWSLIDEPADAYFRSAQVVEPYRLYSAAMAGGTSSADLTPAILVMEAAYTEAAGRDHSIPDATYLNRESGAIGGLTLYPGVYEWNSAVGMASDLTLSGSSTDIFIFKISGALTMAADTSIILAGDAQPKNIFWQVAGNVVIDAGAHFEGIILGSDTTDITFGNLSSIDGRIMSQTAVHLSATTVTQP